MTYLLLILSDTYFYLTKIKMDAQKKPPANMARSLEAHVLEEPGNPIIVDEFLGKRIGILHPDMSGKCIQGRLLQ